MEKKQNGAFALFWGGDFYGPDLLKTEAAFVPNELRKKVIKKNSDIQFDFSARYSHHKVRGKVIETRFNTGPS